jgi:hypothetical protein
LVNRRLVMENEYLKAENRILHRQLGKKRLLLTVDGMCGVSPIARAFCSALLVLSCLGRLEPGDDRSWYDVEGRFVDLVANCTAAGPAALARLPGLLAAMLDSPNELHERERAAAVRALQQLGFVVADPSG